MERTPTRGRSTFKFYRIHRSLHSFPTRRSSDLLQSLLGGGPFESLIRLLSHDNQIIELAPTLPVVVAKTFDSIVMPVLSRSEEHTSELQPPVHLVCRLLLEKKIAFTLFLADGKNSYTRTIYV